ncbi:MAG: hypothetical protein K6E26_06360 [Clostridiales bacterium]|nr:hypothetical protein [Clostridiales bacterium]
MKKLASFSLAILMLLNTVGCSKAQSYLDASNKMLQAAEDVFSVQELTGKEKKQYLRGEDFYSTWYSVSLTSDEIEKYDFCDNFESIDSEQVRNETKVYIYVSKTDLYAYVMELTSSQAAQDLFEELREGSNQDVLIDGKQEYATIYDHSEYSGVYYLVRNGNLVTKVSFSGMYDDLDDYLEFMREAGLRDLQDLIDDYRDDPSKYYSESRQMNVEFYKESSANIEKNAERCCDADEMTDKEKKRFINGHLQSGVKFDVGKYVEFDQEELVKSEFDDYTNISGGASSLDHMFMFKKEDKQNEMEARVYEYTEEQFAYYLYESIVGEGDMFISDYRQFRKAEYGSDTRGENEYAYMIEYDDSLFGAYVKIEGSVVTYVSFNGESGSDLSEEFYDFMRRADFMDMEEVLYD